MKWIDKAERKFGRFGIPNLMLYIVGINALVYVIDMILVNGSGGMQSLASYLSFSVPDILNGQVWRIISFICLPPASSPMWIVINLYFYYLMGSWLENAWGSFRFTLYYVIGILGTILAGLVTGYATNSYINLSLFLAAAQLFPDSELLVFFILPVKMKYLAYIDWLILLMSFIFSDWGGRIAILVSILNFLLFFGNDFINRIRHYFKYRKQRQNFKRQMNQTPWR
ncbi:MAG TPA: rhomboid family intramembrane serine protease [Firmicutes bacterium]|nr:rhomboid family intramembrane serine protease [Bacillota bacterium]